MKRLVLVSVVALAACASEPPVVATAAPPPAQAPGGNWVVVEDYAAESVGVTVSPYLGQVVTLEQGRAIDPAGRLCKTPVYNQSEAPAAATLGNPPQPQATQDSSPRKTITITCDGQPFAALVALPDGSWLTRANSWVLKLAKDAPKPVALAPEPAKPVTMITDAPQPAPAKVAAKPDPRTMVYLASYKTEKAAKDGFKVLAKASPILSKQQPVTHSVDLGKKGQWVRLYGMAADEAERAKICGQLGKRVDECGARNRE